MLNIQRLRDILDLLVKKGVIHAGQRQDVLNRGRDQARHILLDTRAEMRRLLGQSRVAYRVSELTMGWCLNCHKEHPKVDENYGAQAELRRAELKDCYTCHK